MQFHIVTPSFNQLTFLKRCVASVADQVTGGINVHHHVQDACSNDGTVEWLERYATATGKQTSENSSWNEEDEIPAALCPEPGGYSFSYDSAPDDGMYDAIAKGWKRWSAISLEEPDRLLAWLNCDEQYLPGALSKVAAWFRSNRCRELCFGDVLIVDQKGTLQCARKMVSPSAKHIVTEQLPLYTAAMFIRANAVQQHGLYPDPAWQNIGDVELVLRIMQCKLSIGLLHDYTSVFSETGSNLALDDSARREYNRLRAQAPRWVQMLRSLWVLLHRFKKWTAGCYNPSAVAYALFVDDMAHRQTFSVAAPEARWLSRLNK